MPVQFGRIAVLNLAPRNFALEERALTNLLTDKNESNFSVTPWLVKSSRKAVFLASPTPRSIKSYRNIIQEMEKQGFQWRWCLFTDNDKRDLPLPQMRHVFFNRQSLDFAFQGRLETIADYLKSHAQSDKVHIERLPAETIDWKGHYLRQARVQLRQEKWVAPLEKFVLSPLRTGVRAIRSMISLLQQWRPD